MSALAALLLVASCKDKPQAGATCTVSLVCADERTALYCNAGTYVPVACRGPRGCAGESPTAKCDMQLADQGDPCIGVADSYACSVDHKKGLACRDGKWALWRTCKGEGGCTWKNKNKVECDATAADNGDPCGSAGSVACSSDKKALLICRAEKFEMYKACRGPSGCVVKSQAGGPSTASPRASPTQRSADCDNSTGQEGDACDVQEDRICSVDRESQLVCHGPKYVKEKECRRAGGCLFVSHGSPPKCDF